MFHRVLNAPLVLPNHLINHVVDDTLDQKESLFDKMNSFVFLCVFYINPHMHKTSSWGPKYHIFWQPILLEKTIKLK